MTMKKTQTITTTMVLAIINMKETRLVITTMALGDHNYKGSKNNSSNDGAK
jgi:hypothetical protein